MPGAALGRFVLLLSSPLGALAGFEAALRALGLPSFDACWGRRAKSIR